MIDGFRLDVTAEELIAHLDVRIRYHQQRAAECDSKLRQLQALESTPADDEEEMFDTCATSRAHGIDRLAGRHRNREVFLMFARNHVVTREIYRLSEDDLRLLEWLPIDDGSMMMARF